MTVIASGEWRIEGATVRDSSGHAVAQLCTTLDDDGSWMAANGRRIIAAPQLTDACAKALKLIRALRKYGDGGVEVCQVVVDDEVHVVAEVEASLVGALAAAGIETEVPK